MQLRRRVQVLQAQGRRDRRVRQFLLQVLQVRMWKGLRVQQAWNRGLVSITLYFSTVSVCYSDCSVLFCFIHNECYQLIMLTIRVLDVLQYHIP